MNGMAKTRVRNAFTEPSDWWHGFLGFLCAVLLVMPYGWVFSLAIALTFFVYEALEAEDRFSSYEDNCEWLCGFALGLIVVFGLRFGGGV
jgi:hypothetical protein